MDSKARVLPAQQMTNILGEKPAEELHGRLWFTTAKFVDPADIREKAVLNIGCGFGWFEIWALKMGVRRLTAIEIAEENLETARQHIHDPRLEFKVGTGAAIPLPDASCDTVVSWEVIEHIPPQTEPLMFADVKRVLKPGGAFYLSTPHRNFFSIVLDPAFWLNQHRHYSLKFLAETAGRAGFTVEHHAIKAGFREILDIWNLFASKWIFRRRRLFEKQSLAMTDRDYDRDRGFNSLFVKFIRQ